MAFLHTFGTLYGDNVCRQTLIIQARRNHFSTQGSRSKIKFHHATWFADFHFDTYARPT